MINLKEEKLFYGHYVHEVDDLKRVQKALFMHRDIFASLDECAMIWQLYSSNLCASWLDVPKDLERVVIHLESDPRFKGYFHSL